MKRRISEHVLYSNSISWSNNIHESYGLKTVPLGAEKLFAAKTSGLYLPGEFTLSSHLSAERLEYIEKKCRKVMALPQALSLRKQILIGYTYLHKTNSFHKSNHSNVFMNILMLLRQSNLWQFSTSTCSK